MGSKGQGAHPHLLPGAWADSTDSVPDSPLQAHEHRPPQGHHGRQLGPRANTHDGTRLPPTEGWSRGARDDLRPAAKPLSGSWAEDRGMAPGDRSETRVTQLEEGCSRVAELPVPGGVGPQQGRPLSEAGQRTSALPGLTSIHGGSLSESPRLVKRAF